MSSNRQPYIKRKIGYFLFFFVLAFAFGCFQNFYRVNKAGVEEFKEMVNIADIHKYFILHHEDQALHLTDISFQNGNLSGVLSGLPISRFHYRTTNPDKNNRYKSRNKYVLHEVHIFTSADSSFSIEPGAVNVPLSSIREVHVYDPATDATVASHVAGVAGVGIVIAAIVVPIASIDPAPPPSNSSPSSCPYVYGHNGHTFRLQGEVFAGAIFQNLERHDFLPLPDIRPVDDTYQVMISNELREHQHINMAKLAVIEHPEGSGVLLDQRGIPHTFGELRSAQAAVAAGGMDVKHLLAHKDTQFYYFEDGGILDNYVELQFQKPKGARVAKLVINTRNSAWVDLMFGEFTKMYGFYYDYWVTKQNGRSTQEHIQWMNEQGMRLGVYLQAYDDWQLVEWINNIGPLATRDVVIPIDLSNLSANEVKLKISGGHLFWDLDYVAIDFSENLEVFQYELAPIFAQATDGNDYSRDLADDDTAYLNQNHTGHQVTLRFGAIPEKPGYDQAVFLHSKGYYEHERSYKGMPDLIGLSEFDKPGYFIEFSKERFRMYLETNQLIQ